MTTATVGKVTPVQVAQEVKAQGGSMEQGYVAAALVTGIESNGTTNDKNPTSTACGLFQFLTSTWLGNGGGQYAPTACGATMEQQVSVFLHATAGNNFRDWRPDLSVGLNPNDPNSYGPSITMPEPGSPVDKAISSLQVSLTPILGSPQNWSGSAGGVVRANPVPGPLGVLPGFFTGGSSSPSLQDITAPWSFLNTVLKDIMDGFGIGWKGVLTIIGGILLIGVGVLLIFRKQEAKVIEAGAAVA